MKSKIIVAFGGKSLEHDVSVVTAMQAISVLAVDFEVLPMFVTKSGEAYIDKRLTSVNKVINFVPNKNKSVSFSLTKKKIYIGRKEVIVDFVLNCFHGALGEDGSFSGVLNYLEIAYSSCDVLGASISMKKSVQKTIAKQSLVEILPYVLLKKGEEFNLKEIMGLGERVIVKPNNLGSSIGLSVAENEEQLALALELAFMFDNEVLVERKAEDFYELNVSAMKYKQNLILSSIEKPKKTNEVLYFEDKYLSGGKSSGMKNLFRELPADVSPKIKERVNKFATKLYWEFSLFGINRFDFIIEDDIVYFNEVNSVPGSLAYYLFENDGISFKNLIMKVIDEGIRRKLEKDRLIFSIDTKVLKK